MKGELANETVNHDTKKLKHMYQFESKLQVIKKGSPGERTGCRSSRLQASN